MKKNIICCIGMIAVCGLFFRESGCALDQGGVQRSVRRKKKLKGKKISLRKAVQDGDVALVKKRIEAGDSVIGKSEFYKRTLLHSAARLGHTEIARAILEKFEELNVADEEFDLLHMINVRDRYHKSALDYAVFSGNQELENLLRERGALFSTPSLWNAVKQGEKELFFRMLEASGLDIPTVEKNVGSLLRIVIEMRGMKIEKRLSFLFALIAHGAEVDTQQTPIQETPLYYAIDREDYEMVRALLSRGADPNKFGPSGLTPFHIACMNGRTPKTREIVILLLDNMVGIRADLTLNIRGGRSPLVLVKDRQLLDLKKELELRIKKLNEQQENNSKTLGCLDSLTRMWRS